MVQRETLICAKLQSNYHYQHTSIQFLMGSYVIQPKVTQRRR